MPYRFLSVFVVAAALAADPAAARSIAGVEIPPPPEARNVVDTYWGTSVDDPYRHLENTTDPEVQKFMRAQSEAAHALLRRIPARERLLARIQEIDADSPPQVAGVRRDHAGHLFYLKREPKDNQYKLYRRDAPGAPEKVLVDPEALMKATGKPHAIGEYRASPDGKLVAYSISASGSEIGTLHVIDTATLREVTPAIDRIRGAGVSWLEDGSGFFYSRLREGWEKLPRAERFLDNLTYLRKLAAPERDTAVFGPGLHPEVAIERSAGAAVFAIPETKLAGAFVYHGVDPYRSLYLADIEAVLEGRPKWRKVFDKSDLVNSVAAGGGHLYVKSAKGAPRYQLLKMPLADPVIAQARTVIGAGDAVIADLAAAREGLYVTRREGVVKRLYRLGYGADATLQRIEMPVEGTIGLSDAHVRREGLVLTAGGWTHAVKHYVLRSAETKPSLLALAPAGRFDVLSGVVSREVRFRSHDGVEVPLSIVARADVKLDGRNPALLYGYGAYGIVDEPVLSARILAWLEQGGVFAVAHVRGGGIFGDEWRRAGWKTSKPNTWRDGIAAAEWFIANGYTSRDRLAIYGGSAGAIFVGRAITERPDLFASAVIGVGNTDSVRSETRANGAGNIPEYGTVKIEEEFRGLLAMSTYANIKPGKPYPSVMFEHGVNDTRVDVWMTLKTGSRFAAATTSGKPVLMRLEYEGGHGVGSTREQAQQRLADRWSFFLWQAGVPAFQP